MPTLKQGDLIKDEGGDTHKVLGVCGEVVFISWIDNHGRFSRTATEADLKDNGYTWDTPAWEPGALKVEINGKQYVVVDTKE